MAYDVGYQRYPNGGYPVDRFDCVDNPIAQSAGIFHYNHYYYYTFMYSLLWIWGDNPNKLYFEDRANMILSTFGLKLTRTEVDSTEEALAIVIQKLSENKPPVIRTIYKHLFYCGYYQSDEPPAYWDHAIPIYRYDEALSTVSIRDQGHHFSDVVDEYRSALNIHLNVPTDLFQQMLVRWNTESDNKYDYGNGMYQVYALEEKEAPAAIQSFEDIIGIMLTNYSDAPNQLHKLIDGIESSDDQSLHHFLYDLNTSIHATHLLFDGIELVRSFMNAVDHVVFQRNKLDYKHKIQTVVNMIRKSIIKRERLPAENLKRYREVITAADQQLFGFIRDNWSKMQDKQELTQEAVIKDGVYYYIRNKNSNKYLESTSTEDLENVVQNERLCNEQQQWCFQPTNSGFYNLINRYSQKTLDVMFTSIDELAPVGQFAISGHWCQQWEPVQSEDGTYQLKNRSSAKLLSVYEDSTMDKAQIVQASKNYTTSSDWEILQS